MRERSNARGLSASYLEPDRYDDDEEALEQSLLAMKKHYKKGLAKSTYGITFFSYLFLEQSYCNYCIKLNIRIY